MSERNQYLTTIRAMTADERHSFAVRVLSAIADVDPSVSSATLVLPGGGLTSIDEALLRRADSLRKRGYTREVLP